MAGPFATLDDLKQHWPQLPEDKADEASHKLREASTRIRALFPGVDQRIESGALSADVPVLVSCVMVKRALEPREDLPEMFAGMDQVNFAAGPWSMGGRVRNPDGALYLSKEDKSMLSGRQMRTVFSVFPGGVQ